MKIRRWSLLLLPIALGVVGMAIWGPKRLAEYQDRNILNQIHTREVESGMEGYRYSMTGKEKINLLSKCLNHRIEPESEQSMRTRERDDFQEYYGMNGTYAMVVNRRDSSGNEIDPKSGIELSNTALLELKKLGIIPESVRDIQDEEYSAILYSAIDIPEPRNNVLVWKISLDSGKKTADRTNRLLDAYVDADTGKVYEFYVRTDINTWEEIDADGIVADWADYMGVEQPEEYEETNPLAETTPFFRKYTFGDTKEGSTIVTVGYYEGINELFLKISR